MFSLQKLNVDHKIEKKFEKFTEEVLPSQIDVCFRCESNLKGKFQNLPAQHRFNKYDPSEIPECVRILTTIEKRLLNRIIPHLNIFRSKGYYGSKLLGHLTFFPLEVEEVGEFVDLPLTPTQAGIIYIQEKLKLRSGEIQKPPVQIRPSLIKTALSWLISNNHLYSNLRWTKRTETEMDFNQVIVEPDSCSDEEDLLGKGFTVISGYSTLRGSNHLSGMQAKGLQGLPTILACIVYSSIKSIDGWKAKDIDGILSTGERYWKKFQNPPEFHSIWLDDASKFEYKFKNGSKGKVSFGPQEQTPSGKNSLKNALLSWVSQLKEIESEVGNLLVSRGAKHVAIIYSSEHFYLFDAHKLSRWGFVCSSKRKIGYACLLKTSEANRVVDRLFRNFDPEDSSDYIFTSVNAIISNDVEQVNEVPEIGTGTFQEIEGDTLLYPQEAATFLASERLTEVTVQKNNSEKVILMRNTTTPANANRHNYLEEMSFWPLFPDGRNGFSEKRSPEPKTLEYFQRRNMGSDERFRSSEYLFHSVKRVEDERINSNINVLCKVKSLETHGDEARTFRLRDVNLYMNNLRSFGAFWRTAYTQLVAMVAQLGNPFWFLTLSADDLNWPDLIDGLLTMKNGRNHGIDHTQLNISERMELLETYPVVVARYFHRRFSKFHDLILLKTDILGRKVKDTYVRFEHQMRGSLHVHMLIWLEDPPKLNTEEGIRYVESQVSCASRTGDPEFDKKVSHLETHKCGKRCRKRGKPCCFNFPRLASKRTSFLSEEDLLTKKDTRFMTLKRAEGDEMINYYHAEILKIWDAHMDLQVIGYTRAFALYVCKYLSKSEPDEIKSIIHSAVEKANLNPSLNNKVELRRLIRNITKNREMSLQEAAVHICSLPMKRCTRKTIRVNTCFPENRSRMLKRTKYLEGDESDFLDNIFIKYSKRPKSVKDLCLAEFAAYYNQVALKKDGSESENDDEEQDRINSNPDQDEPAEEIFESNPTFESLPKHIHCNTETGHDFVKRKREAIILTAPVSFEKDREKMFYSMLVLFCPFDNEDDLLKNHTSAEEALIHAQKTGQLRNFGNMEGSNLIRRLEDLERILIQINLLRETDENLRSQLGNAPIGDPFRVQEPDNQVDMGYDQEIPNVEWDKIREEHFRLRDMLSKEQKGIYETVKQQIKNDLSPPPKHLPFLGFVSGEGGSGKSMVLKTIVALINHSVLTTSKQSPVIVCAPTGIAALNIGGGTIHKTFSLFADTSSDIKHIPLDGVQLETFCARWSHVKWVIIDEVSMMSNKMLDIVNMRCQELKRNKLDFGGLNVILFGDLYQLPPVRPNGSAVFRKDDRKGTNQLPQGYNLWHQFRYFELKENQRQGKENPFVGLLNRLRVGELTEQDFEQLEQRWIRDPEDPDPDDARFSNYLHIFPNNKRVDNHNQLKIRELTKVSRSRLYRIRATDVYNARDPQAGRKAEDKHIHPKKDKCGGLPQEILLCENARVMLIRNIDVSRGLVNGSMGIVKKIHWPFLYRDQLKPGDQPESVEIEFESSVAGIAPMTEKVYPITTYFTGRCRRHIDRTMIPLVLCWAVTCHKVQGLTLKEGVVCLSTRLFAKGQAYVALSRFRTLDSFRIIELAKSKLMKSEEYSPHDYRVTWEYERLRSGRTKFFSQPTVLLKRCDEDSGKI